MNETVVLKEDSVPWHPQVQKRRSSFWFCFTALNWPPRTSGQGGCLQSPKLFPVFVMKTPRLEKHTHSNVFLEPLGQCPRKITWSRVMTLNNIPSPSEKRLSDFTFTFHFHAWEKEMATHSSVLAWRISGTAEPGGLPSMGPHRVGHD